jgi:hypothetical protein
MRLWTGSISSFASVVMMLKLWSQPPSGSFHTSHRPAKAKGSRSVTANA